MVFCFPNYGLENARFLNSAWSDKAHVRISCDDLGYKYIGVAEECSIEKESINMQNWYSIAIIN